MTKLILSLVALILVFLYEESFAQDLPSQDLVQGEYTMKAADNSLAARFSMAKNKATVSMISNMNGKKLFTCKGEYQFISEQNQLSFSFPNCQNQLVSLVLTSSYQSLAALSAKPVSVMATISKAAESPLETQCLLFKIQ